MYAITGITGQVGGAIADLLLERGHVVRAVVRDRGKADRWVRRGCAVVVAQMTDPDALAEAFAGAEGVFLLIPPLFDPSPNFQEIEEIIAALTSAIHRSRAARVVMLSTVGAQATEPNLLSQLGMVERALSKVDRPIIFLRAAWFMENAAWDVASARAGVIESFLQPPDRAIPMVATRDIAAAAARLLEEPWFGHRIVELQGPAPVSPNDLARAFASSLGRPIALKTVMRERWEKIFREQGMANPAPRMRMLDGFNEGWIRFEGEPQASQLLGETPLESVVSQLLTRENED